MKISITDTPEWKAMSENISTALVHVQDSMEALADQMEKSREEISRALIEFAHHINNQNNKGTEQ